jgi:hypothetical protein
MLHGFGYTAFVIDAFVGLIVALRMLIGKRHRLLRIKNVLLTKLSYREREGHRLVGKTIHRSDVRIESTCLAT